jgi:formylglycine-generating enzyme required for sulfatase activity
MKKLWFAMLLVLVAVPVFGARKALVIGNSAYGGDGDLGGIPVNDANLMASTLQKYDFSVTKLANANKQEMENTIRSFANACTSADEVVFYYSGHGMQVDGINYLQPVGATITNDADCEYHSVKADWVLASLDKPKTKIIILDACRNNPFLKYKGESQKGLALMTTRTKNQYIIYASESGEVASNGSGKNSPFVEELIRQIDNSSKKITDIMSDVKLAVMDRTNDRQSPTAYGIMTEDFYFRAPASVPEPRTSTPANMVYVEGGTFQMGSNDGESDEKPVHHVTVSSFYISKYELTVGEFKSFVNATGYQTTAELEGGAYGYKDGSWNYYQGYNWKNPGFSQNDNHPVTCISWYDAVSYCNWRSQQEGFSPCYTINKNSKDASNTNSSDNYKWSVSVNCSANGYRLPTEAEWEYAARSRGKNYKHAWGNNETPIFNGEKAANVADESAKKQYSSWSIFSDYDDGYIWTGPVGSFAANELSIYDLSGNVWEWCWDWYDSSYYATSPDSDPRGTGSGSWRLIRGGSWHSNPSYLRVCYRISNRPSSSDSDIGVRLFRAK